MKAFIPFFLILTLMADNLFFLPYESKQALKNLYRSLDQAHYTIDIAMYSFTHHSIAKKLKNAAKRGVRIRIILDHDQNMKKRYSKIGYLAKYKNIEVFTLQGKRLRKEENFGKMHIKLSIIDGKKLIFGSANWSNSAFQRNYEILYFVEDYALAKKSEKMFERMLREAKRY